MSHEIKRLCGAPRLIKTEESTNKKEDQTMKKVKIKSYNELKDKQWFVDDMRKFCGMETAIKSEMENCFYFLCGCEDWIWEADGFDYIEEEPIKQIIKIQFGSFVKMLDAKTVVQVFAQDESLLTEKKVYQIWDSPFYDIYHDWDIVAIYSGFGTVIKVQIIPELEN